MHQNGPNRSSLWFKLVALLIPIYFCGFWSELFFFNRFQFFTTCLARLQLVNEDVAKEYLTMECDTLPLAPTFSVKFDFGY